MERNERNDVLTVEVTNISERNPITRAGYVFPPGEPRTVSVKRHKLMEVQAAVGLRARVLFDPAAPAQAAPTVPETPDPTPTRIEPVEADTGDLVAPPEEPEAKTQVYALGGGWYEDDAGRKYHGRQAVLDAGLEIPEED